MNVGALQSFCGLLRRSEAARMRPEHVKRASIFGKAPSHRRITIRLPVAKTGMNQAVIISLEEVAKLLEAWCKRPAPDGTVFGIGTRFGISPNFYRAWHAAMAELGLSHIGFTPHCLRHGGATGLAMNEQSAETIMMRGRWMALSSANRYSQTAEAAFIEAGIPADILRWGDRCLASLHFLEPIDFV